MTARTAPRTTRRDAAMPARRPWLTDALCATPSLPARLWDDGAPAADRRVAVAICGACPVRDLCAQAAEDAREPTGAWGVSTAAGRGFEGGVPVRRSSEGGRRLASQEGVAEHLVAAVRAGDAGRVAELVAGADVGALLVVLAAMVPAGAGLDELVAWSRGDPGKVLNTKT